MADGEVWNFPHPAALSPIADGEAAHRGLTLAICEADEESDRGLAELALAIFLLNVNYDLSSRDHQELLAFEPGSQALRDWRAGLGEIVASHVEFRIGASRGVPASAVRDSGEPVPRWSRSCSRWFSWLRAPSPVRR